MNAGSGERHYAEQTTARDSEAVLAPLATTSTLISQVVDVARSPSPAEKNRTDAGRRDHRESGRLDKFLSATTLPEALAEWFGGPIPNDKDGLIRRLNRDVSVIDGFLNDQLNAILHHPRFQQLEASWRGLERTATGRRSVGRVGPPRLPNCSRKR